MAHCHDATKSVNSTIVSQSSPTLVCCSRDPGLLQWHETHTSEAS